MKHVVIAGCGDLGTALAQQLLARGWQVYGLRRDPSQLPAGIMPIAADLTQAQKPADWPAKVDYLVYCPAAGNRDAELYQQLYVEGLEHVLAWTQSSSQQLSFLLQVSVPASMRNRRVNGLPRTAGHWLIRRPQ